MNEKNGGYICRITGKGEIRVRFREENEKMSWTVFKRIGFEDEFYIYNHGADQLWYKCIKTEGKYTIGELMPEDTMFDVENSRLRTGGGLMLTGTSVSNDSPSGIHPLSKEIYYKKEFYAGQHNEWQVQQENMIAERMKYPESGTLEQWMRNRKQVLVEELGKESYLSNLLIVKRVEYQHIICGLRWSEIDIQVIPEEEIISQHLHEQYGVTIMK